MVFELVYPDRFCEKCQGKHGKEEPCHILREIGVNKLGKNLSAVMLVAIVVLIAMYTIQFL